MVCGADPIWVAVLFGWVREEVAADSMDFGGDRMTTSEDTQDLVAQVAEFLTEHGLTADLVTSSQDEDTIIIEIRADYVAEWSMGQ